MEKFLEICNRRRRDLLTNKDELYILEKVYSSFKVKEMTEMEYKSLYSDNGNVPANPNVVYVWWGNGYVKVPRMKDEIVVIEATSRMIIRTPMVYYDSFVIIKISDVTKYTGLSAIIYTFRPSHKHKKSKVGLELYNEEGKKIFSSGTKYMKVIGVEYESADDSNIESGYGSAFGATEIGVAPISFRRTSKEREYLVLDDNSYWYGVEQIGMSRHHESNGCRYALIVDTTGLIESNDDHSSIDQEELQETITKEIELSIEKHEDSNDSQIEFVEGKYKLSLVVNGDILQSKEFYVSTTKRMLVGVHATYVQDFKIGGIQYFKTVAEAVVLGAAIIERVYFDVKVDSKPKIKAVVEKIG